MNRGLSLFRFALVLVLLAGTAAFLHGRRRSEVVPQAQSPESLRISLDGWQSRDMRIRDDVRAVLGNGNFLSRVYFQPSPEAGTQPWIELFIAYFPSQRAGDTIHSPKNCLPGSGWTPLESAEVAIPLAGGQTIRANRYIVAKGNDRQLVLYWYQAHGRTIASEYWAKFYLVADAIRMNRTDGALVRLVTPLAVSDGLPSAQTRLTKFAGQLIPALEPVIPK